MKTHVEYQIIKDEKYVFLSDHMDLMNELEQWKKSDKLSPEQYRSLLTGFAGQAMQGLLANGANQLMNTTNSTIAIANAKELIKQLEAE